MEFSASTGEEFKQLKEHSSIEVSHYPFDYEIAELGDYPAGYEPAGIYPLYAMVNVNEDISMFSHQVLESVYFDYDNPLFMEYAYYVNNIMPSMGDDCPTENPAFAMCECTKLHEPGTPEWEQCVQDILDLDPDPDPDPNPVTNSETACSCSANFHTRRPSGCITYTDTQFPNNQPVKNVNVRGLNQFGISFSVFTNEFGCWDSGRRLLFFENLTLKVKFNNEKVAIRSLWMETIEIPLIGQVPFIDPFDYTKIVTDELFFNVGTGTVVNNIAINYQDGPPFLNDDRLFYLAAITLNSMEEYHEYADFYNIETPQIDGIFNDGELLTDDVDVLLTNIGGGLAGAAPMIDEMGGGLFNNFNQENSHLAIIDAIMGINAIENEIANVIPEIMVGNVTFDIDQEGLWITNIIENILFTVGEIAAIYSFDVNMNYGVGFNVTTDQIKRVIFHEFGHVGLYEALPENSRDDFWIANIDYIAGNVQGDLNGIFSNNPNGLPFFDGAQRCALNESWAEHIGRIFTDRRYGMDHSLFGGSHVRFLEQFSPDPMDIVPNSWRWMPEGLFLDLMDNENLNDPPNVTDNVTGYDMSLLENIVTENSPEFFPLLRANVIDQRPASVNLANLENILNQYGIQ